MLEARQFSTSIVINNTILFVVGGTYVNYFGNGTLESEYPILSSTEFVTNEKSITGPELPMPISDACFKINDSMAILVGKM